MQGEVTDAGSQSLHATQTMCEHGGGGGDRNPADRIFGALGAEGEKKIRKILKYRKRSQHRRATFPRKKRTIREQNWGTSDGADLGGESCTSSILDEGQRRSPHDPPRNFKRMFWRNIARGRVRSNRPKRDLFNYDTGAGGGGATAT